jgi:3-dehydrotetronate 4-kinase
MLLGCIADDFTGATDLANNLVRGGMRTVQTIGVPLRPLDEDVDAVVVALKSRTIPADEAVAQSLAALEWLKQGGCRQFYFKYCSTFDSTAAGNIGPVTDALMERLGCNFTIACPAFPENGRTVFNGYLFVGGQLLSESGMRNHPLTPMTDANLLRVLQAQTKHKVGLVGYDTVRRDAAAIRARFAALSNAGVQIAIVDALSNDDLMRLGEALDEFPLITAASGVAIGLPQNFVKRGLLKTSATASRLPKIAGHRAIISGSCSTTTQSQVADFLRAGGQAHALDALRLGTGAPEIARALEWAVPRLKQGPVLIYSTAEPAAVKQVQSKLGAAQAGSIIERALCEIACGLVEAGVRQMVVAGGETSGAVVQGLGVETLQIGPEIDPGVPWTVTQGRERVLLALKSGNFGSADFFTRAFTLLA